MVQKLMYKHFSLLVFATRIFFDPEMCLDLVDYAEALLRKFFQLLPAFYRPLSQIMNSHNLIHLADDVRTTGVHLTYISAFPFESCLGHLKQIITAGKDPLAQLVRRISEENACENRNDKNVSKKIAKLTVNPENAENSDLKSI